MSRRRFPPLLDVPRTPKLRARDRRERVRMRARLVRMRPERR